MPAPSLLQNAVQGQVKVLPAGGWAMGQLVGAGTGDDFPRGGAGNVAPHAASGPRPADGMDAGVAGSPGAAAGGGLSSSLGAASASALVSAPVPGS